MDCCAASDCGAARSTTILTVSFPCSLATAPDLVFRRAYETIAEEWMTKLGWSLFLPLAPGDEHLLRTIRVPTVDEQSAMDGQVLTLAQLLVDYLNEKELERRASVPPEEPRGINRLEAFLRSTGFPGTHRTIRFLRSLQTLRSTGSAHRKSSSYGRALTKLGINISDRRAAVEHLLTEAAEILAELREHFLPA